MNRALAEHVAEVRDELERGRVEIERQRQALRELQPEYEDRDAAA